MGKPKPLQSDCAYKNGLLVRFFVCIFFFHPNPDRYCLEDVLKVTEMFHRRATDSCTHRGLLVCFHHPWSSFHPDPANLPFLIKPTILLFTVEVQRYLENMEKAILFFGCTKTL